MNVTGFKSMYYHNHMPEHQKKNLLFYHSATDTTGTRQASYVGVVYDDVSNGGIVGYTAYGKITAAHTVKHVPSIMYKDNVSRRSAILMMESKIQALMNEKLKKNYVTEDSHRIAGGTAKQPKSKPPLKREMSIDKYTHIPVYSYDFPERTEFPKNDIPQIVKDPNRVFERYPNRMRMHYIVLFPDVIALYNISGLLIGDIKYDDKKHDLSFEMLEDIGEGQVFMGHKDPAGNIVVNNYLRPINDPSVDYSKLTWAKQKSMTTYFFNTLYNSKEDIYDTNLPIYMNDYVTDEAGAWELINVKDYGYSSNVVFHDPHSPVHIIKYLER